MEKEQLYQTIEAYLDGELAGEELTDFERELASDETLAKEVALHRSLQSQLGDRSKMDLRATLDDIAKDFSESDLDPGNQPDPPNGTNGGSGGVPFWVWGLAFFLVIGGGVTWYLLTMDDDTVSALPPETTEVREEPVAEPQEDVANTVADDPEPASEEQAAADTPKDPPASQPRPQAYSTNRDLELLITDEPPSRRYEFTDGALAYTEGYITYSGKLLTARSVEEGFFLNLYTNAYPEGRVLREKMTFSEVKENVPQAFAAKKEYIAAYSGETDLEPALYYGVITTGDSSIALWVGKVRVE